MLANPKLALRFKNATQVRSRGRVKSDNRHSQECYVSTAAHGADKQTLRETDMNQIKVTDVKSFNNGAKLLVSNTTQGLAFRIKYKRKQSNWNFSYHMPTILQLTESEWLVAYSAYWGGLMPVEQVLRMQRV